MSNYSNCIFGWYYLESKLHSAFTVELGMRASFHILSSYITMVLNLPALFRVYLIFSVARTFLQQCSGDTFTVPASGKYSYNQFKFHLKYYLGFWLGLYWDSFGRIDNIREGSYFTRTENLQGILYAAHGLFIDKLHLEGMEIEFRTNQWGAVRPPWYYHGGQAALLGNFCFAISLESTIKFLPIAFISK